MAVAKVVVRGLEVERARLAGISERLRNHTDVARVEAQLFETMIRKDVFAKAQAPDGSPWAPLEDSTVERRRNKSAASVKPLQDTRTMFQSVFARAFGNNILFGASDVDDKTLTHQFGSRDGHVPARPFLPVLPDGTVSLDSGPAKRWFERFTERVKRYILTGRL